MSAKNETSTTRSSKMHRRGAIPRWLLFSSIPLLACDPNIDRLDVPETGSSAGALYASVDGVYFHPPLALAPVYSGTFDASVHDALSIVLKATDPGGVERVIATFRRTTTPPIMINTAFGYYLVNVNASQNFTDPTSAYRFHVLLGSAVLGFADVPSQIFQFAQNPAFAIGVKVRVESRPPPVLTSISPATAAQASEELQLTADGSALTSDAVVRFDGVDLATTRVSTTRLTAIIPPSLLARPAGNYDVTVFVPAPGGGTSATQPFAITDSPIPFPVVTALSPERVLAGVPSFVLTIDGSEFLDGASVTVGATQLAAQYVSSTRLTATVPAELIQTDGTIAVTVTNPPPSGGPSAPRSIIVLPHARSRRIAAGLYHTCVRRDDGTARCTGDGFYSQLGSGSTASRTTPVQVVGLTTAVQLSAGFLHTCARLADATVRCWGYNANGALGNGSTTNASTPVTVSGLTNVAEVALSASASCARKNDGSVWCWGNNTYGELGDNSVPTTRTTAGVVPGLNALQIAGGETYACALLTDRTVRCWGRNQFGELGDGTQTLRRAPVAVVGLSNVAMISTHLGATTCAVLLDGTMRCWGRNDYGMVGDGTTTVATTPRQVSGLDNVVTAGAQLYNTCAILRDGTARCWGPNFLGSVGDGTTTHRFTPATVLGLENVVEITGGTEAGFAVLGDGGLRGWGRNADGEFGNGTTTGSLVPISLTF